jgi:drug/metabolite transporter (DMT)-like permease
MLFRGRLCVLAAALLWSISGAVVKSPPLAAIDESYRGPLLACYRALFAAAFLLPFVRASSICWRPMLVPMVISFASMNLLFVTALTKTTAAAAIFLQYTSIIWATLLARVFLGERIDRGNVVALVCGICGIGWIVAGDWNGANFAGNMIALAAGFAYAGVVLCLRVLRDEDSAWLVMLNHAVGGVVLLPWIWTLPVWLALSQWSLIAMLGIVQMGLAYVLFARGVRSIKTQEAALIPLLEPLLNPLWVWLLWREQVAAGTWVGGALIVGGLALRYLVLPVRTLKRHPSERSV